MLFSSVFIIIGPLLVILAFVVYDTLRKKGEFGIRLTPPKCPKCGFKIAYETVPNKERRPNRWECPVCGFLTDQWGNELASARLSYPALKSDANEEFNFDTAVDQSGRTPIERMLADDCLKK